MSRTAKSSMAWGGTLSFARLIAGLIRVKVVALALGVGGVGIFSLLQQVNLTGISLVTMSLAVPIINLGRPWVKDGTPKAAGRIAGTALALVVLNGLILILVAAMAGGDLFRRIGTGTLEPLLLWAIMLSILFGADRFDIYVRAGIASAVVDVVCVAGGAWLYGLRGAIIAMPAGAVVLFGSYALFLRRDSIARQVLSSLSLSARELPRILGYSAMMFAAVALTNVGLTAVRAKVLLEAGASANGYLQTVTSLAAYTLAFVTTGFWGHMHARGALNWVEHPQLGRYLIPLFFAPRFAPAAPLMVAYMPGELCYQLLYVLTAYQLTISRRRRYLAWSLGYIGLLVAIGWALVPHYGAAGYVAAHVGASIVMLAIAAFICWRTGQVTLRLLGMAGALATLLAAMSGLLIWLHWRGLPRPIALLGVIPVGFTGLLAARELLSGFNLTRRRATNAEPS